MTRFAPPEPVSRSSLQRCALTRYPRFISSTTRLVGIIKREYKGRAAPRCAANLRDALSGPRRETAGWGQRARAMWRSVLRGDARAPRRPRKTLRPGTALA